MVAALFLLTPAHCVFADLPGNFPRQDFWVTDGPVYSSTETNGVFYIGGDFKSIAPNGGRGGLFNIFSGDASPLLPQVNGAILSAISDGAGGWYVGGLFTQMGGFARTNLAHILPDLTVDTNWSPNPFGYVELTQRSGVYALLRGSNALYVAGIFTNIAGVTRSNLAALNLTTGAALSWNADVAGEVYCLASRSNVLYAGGRFSAVKGVTRSQIAALDSGTAAVLSWNPDASTSTNNSINALTADEKLLYVGGYFTQIGGAARNGLAALNYDTGLATSWNPNTGNPDFGYGVQAIALTCDAVYFGGNFTNVGGTLRSSIAAVDAATGLATAWNPNADREVLAMTISGNTVYAGGRFTTIGGGAHDSVAALDVNTGRATGWSPRADRGVVTMALAGNNIFLGGGLSAGGLSRLNIAAFDTATGQPLAWNPGVNGAVWTLAVSSNTVYLGGKFDQVAGVSRRNIAAVDRATGAALAWDPDAAGYAPYTQIFALALGNGVVYAGGLFTHIGQQNRNCIVALDPSTGLATSWSPTILDVGGVVTALAVDGTKVYLGGWFTTFAIPTFPFTTTRNYIAEFNSTASTPTSWNPSANDYLYALAVDATNVYAGGFFTHIGGADRNLAAAISRTSGTATAWNPNLSGGLTPTVLSIALSTNAAYLGGGFASAGVTPRAGLAAVDLFTGATNAFDAQLGDVRATVVTLTARGSRLFCGGLFLTVGDEVRLGLSEFVENGFPRFVTQPSPQTLLPGQTINLQAAASGQTPLSYQWQFNGTNLAGATATNLTIANAQVTNSGAYRLTASNSLGQVRSLDAIVTVLLPVSITTQPFGQTNSPGSNIVLSVTASGNPPPAYQWRLNGVNIPGAIGATFTVTNAQPTNGGIYDVLVANYSGAVLSSNALVRITSSPIPFSDNLSGVATASATNGLGSGSNVGATRETGEPSHVGKAGGKSVWYSWTATADGIATFSTRGSSFDTLLAVYTGTIVSNLTAVAGDEDRGGFFTSQISFNAKAGTNYLLAIDGFAGGSGDIVLNWSLDPTSVPFPRILSQPLSQAVFAGQNATFSVSVSSPTTNTYQWYHACRQIAGATNVSLTISNVQERDVGEYTVLVVNASPQTARSVPAYLEISPIAQTLSEDKLADILSGGPLPKPSGPRPLNASFPSVAAGSLGTQILNNYNATTEQAEPIHSDVVGGASRWYKLTAADTGVFLIDTIGSDIDTLLAVYTGTNIFTLNRIASDNNSAPDRIRSLVRFAGTNGADYLIAVDGVNGAQGNILLNWILGNTPGAGGPPSNQSVTQGGPLTLNACQTNTLPPPVYQWRLNGVNIAGATNCIYSLSAIHYSHHGSYSVVISNFAGAITNTVAVVGVEIPLSIARELSSSNTVQFHIIATATQSVILRVSTNLATWSPVFTNADSSTPLNYIEPASDSFPTRYYRLFRP